VADSLKTVNRKGLQVTKSLEASPALIITGGRGLERAALSFRNALETQNRCLKATPLNS
jgi:hypothetical protein